MNNLKIAIYNTENQNFIAFENISKSITEFIKQLDYQLMINNFPIKIGIFGNGWESEKILDALKKKTN